MNRTVRAARLAKHGEPLQVEALELLEPGDGDVCVELDFAGINPIDRYTAEGRVAPHGPLPRTLGSEGAGQLDGRAVMVAGAGLGATRDGVWAQAAIVPQEAVVDLPEGVRTRDAAAMGVAGLTAYNTVCELGRVGAEDRVLVLGAAGGVGSVIVSLAHAAGATVWGQTSSTDSRDMITGQGADRAIVAGSHDLVDAISELRPTVVFDPLGDGFVAPVLDALAPRGRLISFGTSAGPDVELNMQTLYRKMISVLGYGGGQLTADERRSGLEQALEALRAGDLRLVIDDILPLARVNEALRRLEQRRVRGKLLLDLSA
jgi:NADPH2:quinone reductase